MKIFNRSLETIIIYLCLGFFIGIILSSIIRMVFNPMDFISASSNLTINISSEVIR